MPHTSPVTAWNIEARSLQTLPFQESLSQLIHQTSAISDLFSKVAGASFIISGPKGSGKSLLLVAKKKQIEESGDYILLPNSEIVDRPGHGLPMISEATLKRYQADYQKWMRLWSICIMIAAIKLHLLSSPNSISLENPRCDRWTKGILVNRAACNSTTGIFAELLSESPETALRVLDSYQYLSGIFAEVSSQMALFIDSVDEYFAPMLTDRSVATFNRTAPFYQNTSDELWTVGQLALVGAAYRFHKENKNVKVFCTIRQEALIKLWHYDPEAAQINGCVVEIEYEKEDLREIFIKNILLMPPAMLCPSRLGDPMEQFFGQNHDHIKHRFVQRTEPCFDYVLRHTFYRPRDLMTIGSALSRIHPELRKHYETIKRVVDGQSDRLVQFLIGEMKTFFCLPDHEKLFPCIKKNIMTIDELNAVTGEYLSIMRASTIHRIDSTAEVEKPFLAMFNTGMLGVLRTDLNTPDGSCRQHFIRPTEVARNLPELPLTETYFLIHPALDHMIMERSATYQRNFHCTNIIGDDVSWVDPPTSLFVVQGDVRRFSKVMQSEFYREFERKLHEWVEVIGRDLEFHLVSAGDSVLLISKNADLLVSAAQRLVRKAQSFGESPQTFRFGGSAGPIDFEKNSSGQNRPTGPATRRSARLEPYAPEGCLIVDQSFWKLANPCHFESRELYSGDIPLTYIEQDSVFNVQKDSIDDAFQTKLYVIKLTPEV